ncbi:uncharacterized protein CDV56_102690 [Aspergillus thermomutatus]|uniref:Zn(2)-C6 fungal-type domain-containing protein n=1 Tax=Aspergillus thermomutatus TaxID=41047 RepID=A0A397G646_ASPTH|nr:uncharacterized protein CDV56_102690 [Aspergillus thermomutatus]RHZ46511.1 hypothetical protein CDV56_102690 [Aspergillus thermomutatus]
MSDPFKVRSLAPASSSNGRTLLENCALKTIPTRRNASMSCSACKLRKAKCQGGTPCGNCVKHQTECRREEDKDGRRQTSLKRKLIELEQDRTLLVRLLETIRDDEDVNVTQLLNLIRSNAPPDEIRPSVGEGLESLPKSRRRISPDTGRMAAEDISSEHETIRPRPRRKVMTIRSLCDFPIVNVPAKPWTSVTDRDDLVSHLMSLWLTWYHPGRDCMDRDLFIRDMQSKEINSRFCSPFLVNIILAEACFYSDDPECWAIPGDPTSKGLHFFNEAKMHLDKESNKATLTTVQGLFSMFMYNSVIGNDRLGYQYMIQAAMSAEELAHSRARIVETAGEAAPELTEAIKHALQGAFNIVSVSSLALQKPIPMRVLEPMPSEPCNPKENDQWTLYPHRGHQFPAHTKCLLSSLTEFSGIVAEASTFLYGDEKPPLSDLEEAVNLTSAKIMRYHSVMILMFGILKNAGSGIESATAVVAHAKQKRIKSAQAVADLVRMHRTLWGIERIPIPCTQTVIISLFTLLEDLGDRQSSSAFVDLCVTARALSRVWPLFTAMFRSVELSAIQMGVDLPQEAREVFEDFESKMWKARDH